MFFGYKNDVIIGFGKEYICFMINILYLHGVFFVFFLSFNVLCNHFFYV